MYWCKAIAVIALFLAGCSNKAAINANKVQIYNNVDVNTTVYLETFNAFYLVGDEQNASAIRKFYEIYKITNDISYLKEALKLAFVTKDEMLDKLMNEAKIHINDDLDILRMQIGYFVSTYDINSAKSLANELIKKDGKNATNYAILGGVYIFSDEPQKALNAFKKAYELDASENNLLKLVDVLENKFDNTKAAIKYLEDWIYENGCSKPACFTLLNLYSSSGELDSMVELYEELYKAFREVEFLEKELEILVYKKDFVNAKRILEEYGFNNLALIEIYSHLSEFEYAYTLSQKMYEKTKNPEFLAKMAVYKYKKNGKNIGKFELSMVARLFEESVYVLNSGVYYNYYGYLLIDHDMDIKKGLELVKKAYELEPNSPYIIDSIAWGYYKLGNCTEAKIWLDKIREDTKFMNTKDAKDHKIAIDKCYKKGKR
ncbi:hypothetical protein CDQ72_01665 [Campylobacter hyointestinalis subsp. hyointestinalis]|uniref:hypothetical protein n=1 Tax=Campylobacter hyointestinalis TaxID=198 RepID=UPI000CE53F25|nr:hypothetical protein [Campylobacter hyointestinalis]PPB54288.1 hypothetical protein CDQ67_07720 [Campylobacter hyointestinalis subsp. hyointestinalis]PPB63129.1 hypothetical protein CDQ72_01665 [Campylobacter hyointestinalis subsp. hyointestinalis]